MNSKYENYTRDELIKEIEVLKNRKKFGIVWENHEEDVIKRCKKEIPILKEVKDLQIVVDENLPNNILIEGDNYHALSILNHTHAGKIDVIYADPPYNTGARDWLYNNDYVDNTDSYRHSKWLSMMSARLNLAKNLLSDDGIIVITIDDNEYARLFCLMEEVFGEQNYLGTAVIRINPTGKMSQRQISLMHEYAIFFGKSEQSFIPKIPCDPSEKSHKYIEDHKGYYTKMQFRMQGSGSHGKNKDGTFKENYYPIYYDPLTTELSVTEKLPFEILPIDVNGEARTWKKPKDEVEKMYEADEIFVDYYKNEYNIYMKFRKGATERKVKSLWLDEKYSAKDTGTRHLSTLLDGRNQFDFPKSVYAVEDCLKAANVKKDSIILDFFAGSGTTGHAVSLLNKEDGGNRQFILCTNNENDVARNVCYKRVKRVIEGHPMLPEITNISSNLRFFECDYVPCSKTPTVDERAFLTKEIIDMLRIREGAFTEVTDAPKLFKVFRTKNKYVAIIYNENHIPEFKEYAKKINGIFAIYVFSFGNDNFADEFDDDINRNKFEVYSMPEAILQTYRQIFKN